LTNSAATALINNEWKDALRHQHSFALWKLPHQDQIHLIINTKPTTKQKPIFNEIKPGFVFSPFTNPLLKDTIYIAAEKQYTFTDLSLVDNDDFINEKIYLPIIQNFESSPLYFENIVKEGIDLISKKTLKKIVLARCKSTAYKNKYHPVNHFIKLCNAYKNTFVSLVFTPTAGAWIGATPEVLLNLNANGILKTVALAGTQLFEPSIDPKQAIWRQKEIEEQALVSRYIIECFKKVRVREYEDIGPRTIVAGNLMHLKTDFTVDTVAIDYPHLGTSMLELLHPTSAVCGMPKLEAAQAIQAKEQFDRAYFSGFIGPVNFQQQSDVFVNIRCMQLGQNQAYLYAGAGITEDSIPENEWKETEIKMETVLVDMF
jgi:isochorismate synthase